MHRHFNSALIAAPGKVRLQTLPMREPWPAEVVVRLEGCGICGSNLPVWEGRPWFKYPLKSGAPGHEGWGIVERVGGEVKSIVPGDRVAMLSHHAFAEIDSAPEDCVTVLPPALDGLPFPGEALGCAMNVFERCDVAPGQKVAVVGTGFLGALLVRLLSRAGATVYAISRRPAALQVARSMGAAETIPMEDHHGIIDAIQSLTDGHGCERVIEATGFQWPLDLAGELVAERGKLIVAGYHQDGLRQVNLQLWGWKGLDVINAHERDPRKYLEGMKAAAAAVADGTIDPSPLYTHQFPLDRLGGALDAIRDRGGDFMKGLLIL